MATPTIYAKGDYQFIRYDSGQPLDTQLIASGHVLNSANPALLPNAQELIGLKIGSRYYTVLKIESSPSQLLPEGPRDHHRVAQLANLGHQSGEGLFQLILHKRPENEYIFNQERFRGLQGAHLDQAITREDIWATKAVLKIALDTLSQEVTTDEPLK